MLLALHKCLGIYEVVDLKKYCLCHLCIVLTLYIWMLIRQSKKKKSDGSLSWLPAAPCYLQWTPFHQCNKLRMHRENTSNFWWQ